MCVCTVRTNHYVFMQMCVSKLKYVLKICRYAETRFIRSNIRLKLRKYLSNEPYLRQIILNKQIHSK